MLASTHATIPYLQSPYSCHGRLERTFSFAAVKERACAPPDPACHEPAFVADRQRPIPASDQVAAIASQHLLQAQVLSAIDGKRSLNDLAGLLARQYQIDPEQAAEAVRQILMERLG